MNAFLSHKFVSCSHCDRQYDSYDRLKKHCKKRHGDSKIQQCPFCQFVTPTAKALAEHKKLSHREAVIFCLDCDFSTKKWLKWSGHLIGTKHQMKQRHWNPETQTLSSPVPKLQCLSCGYSGHSYKRLKKHYHKHHKEQIVFECPFCDYVTVESPKMKHHKKTFHPHKQMFCRLCDFSTRKWTKWIRHHENGHLKTTGDNISQMIFSESVNQHIKKYNNSCSTKKTSDNFEGSLSYVTEIHSDRKHDGEKETVDLPVTEIKDVTKSTELRSSHTETTYRNVSNSGGLSVSGTRDTDLTVTQQLTGCGVVCSSAENVGQCNSEEPVDSEIHRVESRLSVDSATASISDKGSDVRPLFVCETCLKSFKNHSGLKRHVMYVHSNIRNYTCSECSKTFKTSNDLNQHRLTHFDVRNYSCSECDRTFKTLRTLTRHKLVHSDVRNYSCSECDRTFKTLDVLQRHELIHAGEKCFKCSQCDFATNYKTALQNHMNLHMGVRPYLCEFCDKSFASMGYLRSHRRTHTGERPYKCKYCDFAATLHSSYRAHMRIHLNIKPYKCTECDYSTIHSNNLKYHVRTHTGEKPFACPVCGKHFSTRSNVKKHTIQIHFKDP